MTTERFTKEEFEEVLLSATEEDALEIIERGFVLGEWRYQIVANDLGKHGKVYVEIASSIGRDGKADPTGQNSIRLWLTDEKGAPRGSKVSRWVTRVAGWNRRLTDQLDRLIGMAQAIRFCEKCNTVEKIFIVKKDGPNHGRLFLKCECPRSFTWLDETDQEEEPKDDPQAVTQETKKLLDKMAKMREKVAQTKKFAGAEEEVKTPAREEVCDRCGKIHPKQSPSCPKCGGMMRIMHRKSDNNPFWSCRMWPACNGTSSVDTTATPHEHEMAAEPPKNFVPSTYQQAIFDWIEKTNDNHSTGVQALVVEALAGSGKTTTGEKMMKLVPESQKVAFVAFNKHIAVELQKRAPRHVKSCTLNSLGFAACRKTWGGEIKVDDDKVTRILETVLDKYTHKHLYGTIRQLVSLVKANLLGTTEKELAQLAEYHGIDLNGDADTIFAAVALVIERDSKMTKVIDYDDQIWLPVFHNVTCEKYDLIFVDEAQDLNKANIALVLASIKDNGRLVFVGDRHQSLYGFRGADVNAIPNIIETLGADTLPLSITYRNPKCVVDLVRQKFPDIALEAAPWAQDGAIRTMTEERAMMEVQPGNMVLCRTNAPLVGPAFALIRRGVKAIIRGRDIGKGLIVLVRKMNANDLPDLLKKLEEYKNKEVAKLQAADKGSQAQSVQDKVETIFALADGIDTISQLEDRVEMIFSDDAVGVVFSSVHRAKGLEANRVFILHPELLPHPMAKKEWEMVQERNIQYVAYTRVLSDKNGSGELVFVQ